MAAPKYLRVRKWDDHQHYKSGPHSSSPAWIKLYIKLLYDEKITGMSIAAQLLADRLLLVAATVENRIPNDEKWIESATKVQGKYVPGALDELRRIRFVEPFSERKRSRDALEQNRTEKNRKETTTTDSFGNLEPTALTVIDGGSAYGFEGAILELLGVMKDRDDKTADVVRSLIRKHRLSEGDIRYATECARGPGVESPTRVGVATLRKRGAA